MWYCQAQPKIQLSWAELALNLKNPASASPPGSTRVARKLKFNMQASFNPTRTNINKKNWELTPK
jgi:hypothetical protein